jgi:hypothetical protein
MKLKVPVSIVAAAYIATQPASHVALLAAAHMTLAPHALHFRQFGAQMQARYPYAVSLDLPISNAMFRYMDVVRFNTTVLREFFAAVQPATLAALRGALKALRVRDQFLNVRWHYIEWRKLTRSTLPTASAPAPQSAD